MAARLIEIPEALAVEVDAMAAKAGVSTNEVVRALLEGFVQAERAPLSGNIEILLQFSLGQLEAAKAAQMLHLADENILYLLVRQVGLPLPRLSLEQTEAMRKQFGEMLDKCAEEK